MSQLIVFFCTLLLCASTSFSEVIVLRDGAGTLHGTIQSSGDTGLLIQDSQLPSKTVRIPWSTIRQIQPEKSRTNIDHYLEVGELLWRAKRRLLRGDVLLSQPIFESQFEKLLGTDGEDSRLVAEGLLRTLVAQGLLKKAVVPWLETVRLDELGVPSPFASLDPILEEQTRLCRHLPLMAIAQVHIEAVSPFIDETLPITSLCASLVSGGNEQPQLAEEQFTQLLATAMNGSVAERDTFLKTYNTLESWQQIWIDYALGIAYLHNKEQDSAMISFAKVASADPHVQPYLSGSAMLLLADELELLNHLDEANRIRYEAKRLFPSHPLVLEAN